MHIHVLGICGTFMAGVAALARAAGHRVTGSDQAVYPPMSEQLGALGIDLIEGYDAAQLEPAPDMVVVGNVMSRGMPVVEALLDSGLPYASGPEWLARELLPGRRVIAVAGTHGKTTTTSLLAWILEQAGLSPGFLIGGIAENFGISARLGDGEVFVIEADEYDTAFFDKRAKFLWYRPRVAVINNLEYDHADIYPDLAAIRWQFHQLLRGLPSNGRLLVPAADPQVEQLLALGCWTPVETVGSDPDGGADWLASAVDGELRLTRHGQAVGSSRWSLLGSHNAENAAAAIAAAAAVGVEPGQALAALGSFAGVKRRLQHRGEFGGVSLYDDFAHHPTAIRRTLAGLREASSGRLLVILEPRSNTMRLGVHREALASALADADQAWLFRPADLDWDPSSVADAAAADVFVCDELAAIVRGVAAAASPGDCVVVMSNGGFGGIQVQLEAALAGRG